MLLLFFIFGVVVNILPPPAPQHSLDIYVANQSSDLSACYLLIVISNISKNAVMYEGGSLEIAYLKDKVWVTNSIERPPDELALQGPGTAMRFENLNSALTNITTAKAGLTYTSLTWRGCFAWNIPGNSVIKPLADYLIQLDISKRSKTEWSPVFYLNATTNNVVH